MTINQTSIPNNEKTNRGNGAGAIRNACCHPRTDERQEGHTDGLWPKRNSVWSGIHHGKSAILPTTAGNAYITQLSIPGAHDAGTGYGFTGFYGTIAGPSMALTQDLTIEGMWDCGVRAFDLRVAGSRIPASVTIR